MGWIHCVSKTNKKQYRLFKLPCYYYWHTRTFIRIMWCVIITTRLIVFLVDATMNHDIYRSKQNVWCIYYSYNNKNGNGSILFLINNDIIYISCDSVFLIGIISTRTVLRTVHKPWGSGVPFVVSVPSFCFVRALVVSFRLVVPVLFHFGSVVPFVVPFRFVSFELCMIIC